MGVYSILVLAAESGFRERVCGEISRGVHCQIYTASDAPAALALVRAEQPSLFLVSPEFAGIHGKPIAEVVTELSPTTVVALLPPSSRTAAPGGP
ncbi:MAG: hypothetical protein ACRD3E_14195 [Terriglobales bacterium]